MRLPRPRPGRFTDAASGALWYLLIVVVLPVTSLVVAGLVFLWRQGTLLNVLVGWLAVTLVAYLLFVLWPRKRAGAALREAGEVAPTAPDGTALEDGTTLPAILDPRPGWTARDREVYARARALIDRAVGEDVDWELMRTHATDTIALVAAGYHGESERGRLRFTLPEALLVVQVASERYRKLVLTHVPFADRVTLATVAGVAGRRNEIRRGARWANNLRRGARLANPVGAVVGELRDQLTDRVLGGVSRTMQRDLMRLMLQEIAQVAIELYSGRLKATDVELAGYRSRAAGDDERRRAEPAEPLRVVLLGQVGAGKSSLVNALADALRAETDRLPTTDRATVHVLRLGADGGSGDGADDDPDALPPIHLVDMPGIDGDADRRRELVDAVWQADLVVHVARANQPGRAADAEVHRAVVERFDAHPERRPPPALLVLTHVDLLTPRAEWSPPYPLDGVAGADVDPADRHAKKAATIRAALESARRQIGLDADVPAVPVRLGEASARYNVDAVAARIGLAAEAAIEAQFNRRRVERSDLAGGWRARWGQARNLGVGLGKVVLRSG